MRTRTRAFDGFVLLAMLCAPLAMADMERLDDDAMASVSGQGGGMSLSGDITINENGGPISDAFFGDCTDDRRCGARLAAQLSESGGWLVMDDFRGRFLFDGLTLRVRDISSGFAGDGAAFDGTVLEVGLPGTVTMENVRYTMGTSSAARPSDAGFQQTDFYSVQMEGDMTLQGNMLIFPTGNQ